MKAVRKAIGAPRDVITDVEKFKNNNKQQKTNAMPKIPLLDNIDNRLLT